MKTRRKLLTKVGVRKIFVATFASYGTAITNEGRHTTALLLDVKDHGTIATEHVWIKVNEHFSKPGFFKKGDEIVFTARVMMYQKRSGMWDVGLENLTKVKKREV